MANSTKIEKGHSLQLLSLANGNEVPSIGSGRRVTGTITIGTGAAHSAGDVVSTDAGAVIEWDTSLPAGSAGMILAALSTLNHNAVFADGAGGYTLYLFNVAPTAIATNTPFSLATLTGYLGKISISTLVDEGGYCAVEDLNINKPFQLATEDTKLYGIAVAKGDETTVTGKILSFIFDIIQI